MFSQGIKKSAICLQTSPTDIAGTTSSLPRCCRANVRKSQFCFHLTFDPLQVANNLYLKNLEPMDMFYYSFGLEGRKSPLLYARRLDWFFLQLKQRLEAAADYRACIVQSSLCRRALLRQSTVCRMSYVSWLRPTPAHFPS